MMFVNEIDMLKYVCMCRIMVDKTIKCFICLGECKQKSHQENTYNIIHCVLKNK